MAIVEVRPLNKKKWHGKSDKESFTRPTVIQVLYDHNTGKYATGLTDEEMERFSRELGLRIDDKFNPAEEHPYWSSKAAQIKLENHTMFFNTDKASDYIKVKNMKAQQCQFVANSLREWEENKWPEATHVIFDESEEATIKASKIEQKKKAYKLSEKMTVAEKAAMVLILTGKYVKNKSANYIEVALDEAIEENMEDFLTYASMDAIDFSIRGQILEGLHRQILTKEGGAIYYMGERLGFDINDAIDYFKDPNNQKIKVAILEKLTG
jgi:hypothetical protein